MYRRKAGISVFLLCGCIFASVGTLFLVISIFMALNMDYVIAHGEGDVWILPFIFGLLGGIFAIIGFALIVVDMKQRKNKRRLIEQGNYVLANIMGVVADPSVRINGWPTFRVECCWEDRITGTNHVFYSENLAMDPTPMIEQNTVRVYVDRESGYQSYFVDIDSVLSDDVFH